MMTTPNRTSIEFVVKPKEDLYLEGVLRKLPRVTKGEAYPCQMQKNQNFSCLFRHYAKHNGLRKEDLVFSFVDDLAADQTPESVHLMPQDEIWVEHRQQPESIPETSFKEKKFYSDQFQVLLDTGIHSDIKFVFDNGTSIDAHKAILSARSEYFDSMFQSGGMSESRKSEINVSHDPASFRRLLEFIYTNWVTDLETCTSDEIVSLLILANEYCLEELIRLSEKRAGQMINPENIGQLFLLSAGHNASSLRDACGAFVEKNKSSLVRDPVFRQELERNPELGLLVFEYSISQKVNCVGTDDSGANAGAKKRRRSGELAGSEEDDGSHNTNTIAQSNARVQD